MKSNGFDVYEFPLRGRTPKGLWCNRGYLKELQPDVLHANDPHALTAAGMAGLGLAIPLRVASRRVDFPVRSKFRYRQFADGVICVSNAVADVCVRSGIRADRLTVVHDGVEPAFASSGSRQRGRDSLKLTDKQQLLLTVAKLTDHKGHRYLLDAMPQILKQHPNAVLAFAGEGELRQRLADQIVALGVQNSVRLLGYRSDIPDLLAAADVIVQPSHLEGLCSSLIDAMLAERPIVATRAGGIPDLLESNGETRVGWLVEPKSPAALNSAICSALSDPAEAAARARNACSRANEKFTADQMVENTLQAYAKIAAQTSRTLSPSILERLSLGEDSQRSAA